MYRPVHTLAALTWESSQFAKRWLHREFGVVLFIILDQFLRKPITGNFAGDEILAAQASFRLHMDKSNS